MWGSTARDMCAGLPFRQLKRLECKKCVGDPPPPPGRVHVICSTSDLCDRLLESVVLGGAAGLGDNR
jgi:hypothetical protein